MNYSTSNRELPYFLENPKQAIAEYLGSNYLVLDFEADGLDPYSKDFNLVLACWWYRGEKYHAWTDSFGTNLDQLFTHMKQCSVIVGHGLKYDLECLRRVGVELRDYLLYDTLLGEWVRYGNQKLPFNLEDVSKRYGGQGKHSVVSKLIKAGVPPSSIHPKWLLRYCSMDVEETRRVFLVQRKFLHDRDQLHLVLVRSLTCACLAHIEESGMRLDEERVNEEYAQTKARLAEVSARIEGITGGINLRSRQQLAEYLYDTLGFKEIRDRGGAVRRTATGQRATDLDTISQLIPKTDEQREFATLYAEYNQLTVALSKNLAFFKGIVDEHGGIFRASFNQARTATHRLSSTGNPVLLGGETVNGVQFQNLPRGYKRLFRARQDGRLLAEVDGSQLEFRVAADLARDELAATEVHNGVDIHANTALALTEAGFPVIRQEAKAYTFKPLYGGKGAVGTPARAYSEFFQEKYRQIAATQRAWALSVADKKYLRTEYGMMYFWPQCKIESSGYISFTTEIYNYPVQGFATAEIVPIALVFLWHMIRDTPEIELVNTVHDSLICEIEPEVRVKWEEIAVHSMTRCVYKFLKEAYNYDFVVDLGAGVKVSTHWGDTKEESSYNCTKEMILTKKEK